MSEFRRKTVAATAVVVAALGLTGCGKANAETLENAPLVDRFEYDYTSAYLGSYYREDAGDECFAHTAYDTERYPGTPASATVEDGILVVSPANTSDTPLRLVNEGNDRPLQPADDATRTTLEAYGCNIQPYGQG